MCMSSHKQYQIIDVFCNVHCNVNSYSNSKLNCPQVLLFPEPSLKYSQCFIHAFSGQFLKLPVVSTFLIWRCPVFVSEMVLRNTRTSAQFSQYSPVSPLCSKHSSTSTGMIRGVSFEPRTCRGISRQTAGFLWDKAAVLGAKTKRRPCSGPLGMNDGYM